MTINNSFPASGANTSGAATWLQPQTSTELPPNSNEIRAQGIHISAPAGLIV